MKFCKSTALRSTLECDQAAARVRVREMRAAEEEAEAARDARSRDEHSDSLGRIILQR